jgi:AraC-like DNA-binding protein
MNHIAYDEPTESADRTPLPQHVRHAVNHIRANMADKITLADLASACDVSERTLHKQFRRFLGVSPLAYLQRLRLSVVRAELTEPDHEASISDIAIRAGFSHLGRFAVEYRRRYSESPSASRRRVRAESKSRAFRADDNIALASVPGQEKPSLLIVPLYAETLREKSEARELTEQITVTLSRMRLVSVKLADPCHAASMEAPRPRNVDARYCLLGRLTQRNPRTRCIVRLVDVATDKHVWGDSFDGLVNDPFELQDRVVDGVLCGVVSNIIEAAIERVRDKNPDDLAARDLATQALPFILATNVPSTRKAIAILNRAIELDPASALPVALLACCHAHLGMHYGSASPAVARATAMQLMQRAGVLDERDPLVTLARGTTAAWALQPHDAEMLVTRALAMDPTSAWAWERRGTVRVSTDPEGAIADFIRALGLRGPSFSRGNCFGGIAQAHAAAGRIDDALLWQRRALAENPTATWMYILDSCYALKSGDWPRVMEGVEHMRHAQPEFSLSLIMATYPPADPEWLDALSRAGMPLT